MGKTIGLFFNESDANILEHLRQRIEAGEVTGARVRSAALDEVCAELTVAMGIKVVAKFSRLAGCTCPCSPGFKLVAEGEVTVPVAKVASIKDVYNRFVCHYGAAGVTWRGPHSEAPQGSRWGRALAAKDARRQAKQEAQRRQDEEDQLLDVAASMGGA